MGIFGKLFGKQKKMAPANLGDLHTDVHSHFIPGIDDGAKTIEDSLEMIEAMMNFGYKKVITTPHVMSDHYRNTPDTILGGLKRVKAAVQEKGWEIEIEAAAEYNIDADFEEKIDKKEILTFGDNYILVEMPFFQEPTNLKDILFKLQTEEYRVVLAHVERYPFWHKCFDKIVEMHDRGIYLQLNINSLTGFYGPEVKKVAEQCVNEGIISLLGSDCHHMNHVALMEEARTRPHLHKVLQEKNLINRKV